MSKKTISNYLNLAGSAPKLDTCLGPMIAIAHDKALYLLEFVDQQGLEYKIERLGK